MTTPGPWTVQDGLGLETIIGADGKAVTNPHRKCDARLIAAAPELLEACKMAFDNLKPAYSSDHLVIRTLRAAIAKAEGKQ